MEIDQQKEMLLLFNLRLEKFGKNKKFIEIFSEFPKS